MVSVFIIQALLRHAQGGDLDITKIGGHSLEQAQVFYRTLIDKCGVHLRNADEEAEEDERQDMLFDINDDDTRRALLHCVQAQGHARLFDNNDLELIERSLGVAGRSQRGDGREEVE